MQSCLNILKMELRKSRRKKRCNVSLQPPFPVFIESELGISLDHWEPIICTGKFNGFGIVVKDRDEINMLNDMGFFGKGNLSRSSPRLLKSSSNVPTFIRNRQYQRRKQWYNKHRQQLENCLEGNISALRSQISRISRDATEKDDPVIELLSSDDEVGICGESGNKPVSQEFSDKEQNIDGEDNLVFPVDSVIILPDSEDEKEDYFRSINPRLYVDKSGLKENLILTLQESFFLAYALGCLQIIDNSDNQLSIEESWQYFCKIQEDFPISYTVYHYFRAKGYIVKPGIKFGGDYLLYKDGPPFYHADYVVIVESVKYDDLKSDRELSLISQHDWTSLHGIMRMANTAVKEVLIAQVIVPEDLKMDNIATSPEHIEKLSVNELLVKRHLQEKEKEEL